MKPRIEGPNFWGSININNLRKVRQSIRSDEPKGLGAEDSFVLYISFFFLSFFLRRLNIA